MIFLIKLNLNYKKYLKKIIYLSHQILIKKTLPQHAGPLFHQRLGGQWANVAEIQDVVFDLATALKIGNSHLSAGCACASKINAGQYW